MVKLSALFRALEEAGLANATIGEDNDGQVVVFTDMRMAGGSRDTELVPFKTQADEEMELFIDHVGAREAHQAELIVRLNLATRSFFVVKSRYVDLSGPAFAGEPSAAIGPLFDLLWAHSTRKHTQAPEVRWFVA